MRTKTIIAVALSTLLLAPAAFAQNSGAGKAGLPGNKSGPAAPGNSSAPAVPPEQSATPPDTSGVKGLPGNKSGPAVQSPKSDRTR